MKLDALDHPKTLDFASRLKVELPAAIGHLELLWAFTAKKAPQGNIGKWTDGAISMACHWKGEPCEFIGALVEAGFLDTDADHRYLVHDWHEHAFGWVRAKLKKTGQVFLVGTSEPTSEASLVRSSDPTNDTGSQVKTSLVKSSQKQKRNGAGAPSFSEITEHFVTPGLDVKAWGTWIDYRKQIRRPLKPASIPAAQRNLAAYGSNQMAVVEQSIANGWQGLFDLKRRNGSDPPKSGKLQRAADALRKAHGTANAATTPDRGTGTAENAGPTARLRSERG